MGCSQLLMAHAIDLGHAPFTELGLHCVAVNTGSRSQLHDRQSAPKFASL
jgi:hypothetical protein